MHHTYNCTFGTHLKQRSNKSIAIARRVHVFNKLNSRRVDQFATLMCWQAANEQIHALALRQTFIGGVGSVVIDT
jgi:hypothetical protein